MFPNRLERDTPFISFIDFEALWCTTSVDYYDEDLDVRSDGTVNVDNGTFHCNGQLTIAANKGYTFGAHITGPHRESDLTAYAYNAVAWSPDLDIYPLLFVGTSPATINDDATGNIVTECRYLAGPVSGGKDFNVLQASGIVSLPPPVTDLPVCFGIACMSSDTAGGAKRVIARLSVKRLVSVGLEVLDTAKLG